MGLRHGVLRNRPEGELFLQSRAGTIANILCSDKYHDSLENVIVEGHSDSAPYRGATLEESQQMNLKLSQDRSMEVVKKMLLYLNGSPRERACLLEKLSATGRGEQDLESTADKSRRVVFKIRVNSSLGPELAKTLSACGAYHGRGVSSPDTSPRETASLALLRFGL